MRTRTPLTVGIILALSLMAAPAIAATVGPTGHDRIPTAVPSAISPNVTCSTCGDGNDGSVLGIVQVEPPAGGGNPTMVIGGEFSHLTPKAGPEKNISTARTHVASFDAVTGALRSSFNPVLNGVVDDVLEGPTPNTVYIAGKFTKVGTVSASHLALLDVNTGAVVTSFKAPPINGEVNTITKAGSRLLLGGFFTTAGGAAFTHQGLAAVNATTGAIDHTFMNIGVTERHNNSGSGALGSIGVKDMEATPDGTKLVAIGNFRKADNDGPGTASAALTRVQILVADLSGATAVVSSGWNTSGYEPLCYKFAFDSTVRGVAISPDGSYFVVSATGGGTKNTLCDTAARFEFSSTGTNIQPTWIDSTGGDTLWSVEITEKAVYVGGHQRWQNNIDGVDQAEQGAVPRPGLAALDIESGLPIAWNPGRLPRGLAVFVIYASPTGLWLGSDTDYIGNFAYKRAKLAYFPLAGGAPTASEAVPALPGDVYLGGRTSTTGDTNTDISAVKNFNGSNPTNPVAVSRPMPWDSVRGGAFVIGDQLFYGKGTSASDAFLYKRTFTTSETGSTETKIDPYNDPAWADAPDGVGGTERGKVPGLHGLITTLSAMFYANDRIYYTRNGSSNVNTHLYWRWFNADSGIIGSKEFTADGPRTWADTAGLFVSGNTLYIVSKALNGGLRKMPFINNAPSGTVTNIDTTRDYRAKAIFLGPQAPPANVAPTAAFPQPTCTERTCSVNGSGSTDSDGTIENYEWTFGDGGTATGATPANHTYAADGEYTITLKVTDNQGATNSTTRVVNVAATPPPSSDLDFRAQAQASNTTASTTNSQVTIPATVQVGDRLVLIGSYGFASAGSPANPTTPTGWTQVGSTATNSALQSAVWTKVAGVGDAGAAVSTPLAASSRSTMTVAAYKGVAAAGGVAAIASSQDVSPTSHTSPSVSATAGDWVVQFWTDKSSNTTLWTPPSGVTQRGASYGSGTGRTSALLADSGGPVTAGSYGGQTATSNGTSGRAIAWTFLLHPSDPGDPPANVAPTAAFPQPTCSERTCTVNGSSSTDSDGTIESYEWTFGDGGTATGATPADHTYAADGEYTITLTVTDDGGLTNSTTRVVNVSATPPPSSDLGFRAGAMTSNTTASTTNSQVSIPANVESGDQLVLIGSYAYASAGSPANPTTPAGWTQVGTTATNSALQSAVWTKVATAGDAGTTVATPLAASSRSTMTVAAYQGVAATDGIAAIASSQDVSKTDHTSPTVTAPAGDWVVQFWTDKNSGTTAWTAPGGVTQRDVSYGSGTGRTSALLVDSGGPVTAGTHGGATATTNVASGRGISWTFVLHPAETP